MRHQNPYTYLNMAAIILVWISTVDDGHMTKLVIIATIHNISHLEEKKQIRDIYNFNSGCRA